MSINRKLKIHFLTHTSVHSLLERITKPCSTIDRNCYFNPIQNSVHSSLSIAWNLATLIGVPATQTREKNL